MTGRACTSQWLQRCMHLGRPVRIVSDEETLEGIARGITERGISCWKAPTAGCMKSCAAMYLYGYDHAVYTMSSLFKN